jgi:hypothetical protein
MVDGLESYFERRFEEFDLDMEALGSSGFPDVRLDYVEAKNLLFGVASLTQPAVASVVSRLLEEREEDRELLAKLGVIYDRLITRLPEVAAFRDDFGVERGFYE